MITGKLRSYRTLFISDTHLGSPHCQVERLLRFLRSVHFEKLVLVGDIFDDLGMTLPERHVKVVNFLLRKMLLGTEVVFVPGNHDALFRNFCGTYGNLQVVLNYVHVTANNKRVFVLHGDEVDNWPMKRLLYKLDRRLVIPFWEMLGMLAKNFLRAHIKRLEGKLLATGNDYDYVLCGHVHTPMIRDNYINTGDWLQHCSAVVEHWDGTLELVNG